MSQSDIFNILQKRNRPLTNKDISKELGITTSAVSRSTRKMADFKLINMEIKKTGKFKQRTPYFKLF